MAELPGDRAPEWKYLGPSSKVAVWECITLWGNVNPKHMRPPVEPDDEKSWLEDGRVRQLIDEVTDPNSQIEIVEPCPSKLFVRVRLGSFAKWAIDQRWPRPPRQLKALAKEAPPPAAGQAALVDPPQPMASPPPANATAQPPGAPDTAESPRRRSWNEIAHSIVEKLDHRHMTAREIAESVQEELKRQRITDRSKRTPSIANIERHMVRGLKSGGNAGAGAAMPGRHSNAAKKDR